MNIQVDGNGNRVALNDYYENATLTLTPEQLRQLAPRKCPACEVRLLGPGESACNTCRAAAHARHLEELSARRMARAGHLFVFFLAVWGVFLTIEQKAVGYAGVSTERFWELGSGALGTCLLAIGGWLWAREWWWRNGSEFMDAMSRKIKRKLGL